MPIPTTSLFSHNCVVDAENLGMDSFSLSSSLQKDVLHMSCFF